MSVGAGKPGPGTGRGNPAPTVPAWVLLALLLLGVLALNGCQSSMVAQPRYDPLEPSAFFADGMSARQPVSDTVPVGAALDNPGQMTGVVDGQPATEFPFELNEAVLARGQERYNIFCAPCHGYTGEGNGMVVQRGFPAPPTLHSDRLRSAPPGYYFQVITHGFGRMLPYESQVPVDDRWAITAYIRALQLSQSAPASSLPQEDQQQLQERAP